MTIAKQQGVRVTSGPRERTPIKVGPPNTVLVAKEIKFVSLVYTDKVGQASKTKIGVFVGNQLLEDPEGEAFAKRLHTLKAWVADGARELLKREQEVIEPPKEDKVDVIVE